MAIMERSMIVGIFAEEIRARMALEELDRAGFSKNQLGLIKQEQEGDAPFAGETQMTVPLVRTAAGAVGGGVIGGVAVAAVTSLIPGLGPVLAGGMLGATLGGAVMGALAGGFLGTFMRLGIPEAEARFYQEELKKGHVLVTVRAGDRTAEANAILRQSGAYSADGQLTPLIEMYEEVNGEKSLDLGKLSNENGSHEKTVSETLGAVMPVEALPETDAQAEAPANAAEISEKQEPVATNEATGEDVVIATDEEVTGEAPIIVEEEGEPTQEKAAMEVNDAAEERDVVEKEEKRENGAIEEDAAMDVKEEKGSGEENVAEEEKEADVVENEETIKQPVAKREEVEAAEKASL